MDKKNKSIDDKLPEFDADFPPNHPQNVKAAKARGLIYDEGTQMYVDEEGYLMRDRYGQRL